MSFIIKMKQVLTSRVCQSYPKVSYSPARTLSDDGSASFAEDRNSMSNFIEKSFPLSGPRRSLWSRYRVLIIAHFVLFSLYGISLYSIATRQPSKFSRKEGLPFSPAIEALEFEERSFPLEARIQERSRFSGRPSASLDKAWHDLLHPENIRIESEVMEHYGRLDTGVQLPDGDGYLGILNVYHELHCLKRIHQYMYQEHYFPDLDDDTREMNRMHNEHCIDFLRQASMCHGDIGLITFEWIPESRIPVAKSTTHQCVNWNKLENWTKNRTIDLMRPGWLVHPTLGVAYPDGKGDNIGAVVVPDPALGNVDDKVEEEDDDAGGY